MAIPTHTRTSSRARFFLFFSLFSPNSWCAVAAWVECGGHLKWFVDVLALPSIDRSDRTPLFRTLYSASRIIGAIFGRLGWRRSTADIALGKNVPNSRLHDSRFACDITISMRTIFASPARHISIGMAHTRCVVSWHGMNQPIALALIMNKTGNCLTSFIHYFGSNALVVCFWLFFSVLHLHSAVSNF